MKAIASDGIYQSADWVVSVDAHAVFVPSRLAAKMQSQLLSQVGST